MRKFLSLLFLGVFLGWPADRAAIAAEEHNLTLNLPIPPIHSRWTNALKPWTEELERRSEGRIKVEPFFAEAISKQAEAMDSVREGLADMTEATFSMGIGQFPFYERAFDLADPGRSLEGSAAILHQLEKEFPQLAEETRGVKMLFTHSLPIGMLIGTKEPVASLAELKGKKIAVIGGATAANTLKELGASVVNIPMSDIYMALQQGIIDGSMVDFQLLTSRRYGDLLKHVAVLPINGGAFYFCMNEDVYNGLPDDLKKIVDEMAGEYGEKQFEEFWKQDQLASLEKWLQEMGGALHVLSAEDYQIAREKRRSGDAEWIKMAGKNGLPAADILKRYRELEAQHDPEWQDSMLAKYFTR